MTACIFCLHTQYPGQYLTGVKVPHPSIFWHNPHVVDLDDYDLEIDLGYDLIQSSNQRNIQFLAAFVDDLGKKLGIQLECMVNRPFLYLAQPETTFVGFDLPDRFALVNAGFKGDYPIKDWGFENYQELVYSLYPTIQFVQIGNQEGTHQPLDKCINLVNQTSIRDVIRLSYHAEFGVGPSTFLQHCFAAWQKPYFCIQLREPLSWVSYPTQRTLTAQGLLPCCQNGGCWVNKVEDCRMQVDKGDKKVPLCLAMITPARVKEEILLLYDSGVIDKNRSFAVPIQNTKPLFPTTPTLGLVIGTAGYPAYTAMHLETAKRLYPDLPILVHDDWGTAETKALCDAYGADIEAPERRQGHGHGDLRAFTKGLRWADGKGIDLLVKMSRRFVPLVDWRPALVALALANQCPTYSSWCVFNNFGFRTECLGLAVGLWKVIVPEMEKIIAKKLDMGLPEKFVHDIAQRIWALNQPHFSFRHQTITHRGYCFWEFMGTSRLAKSTQYLWHNANDVSDYMERCNELGLGYKQKTDFNEAW